LIYRDESIYEPDYKLVQYSTDKDTIVASINFFPDFNTLSLPEAKALITDGKEMTLQVSDT